MEKNRETGNKMGTMTMPKLIINMSLPLMISLLVQSLYNIVDSIFVKCLKYLRKKRQELCHNFWKNCRITGSVSHRKIHIKNDQKRGWFTAPFVIIRLLFQNPMQDVCKADIQNHPAVRLLHKHIHIRYSAIRFFRRHLFSPVLV